MGVRYLLSPIPLYLIIKHKILVRKWSHHADSRRFDWIWSDVQYNRAAAVNLIISKYPDPFYLEIGCGYNTLFDSVPGIHKVGVDIKRGGTLRMSSDDFFNQNKESFDIIFIDGLHEYDQIRKDVVNALKCVHPNGWILLHDMLPRNWTEQHVPCISIDGWTGDVWKVAFELAQTDGIEFKILKIDHGVGVVKILKQDILLKDLTDNLGDQQFSYYYDHFDELPVIEWKEAYSWLQA